MSRIGKLPINKPEGVSIEIAGRTVTVKGPKGELTQQIEPSMGLEIEEGQVTVTRPNDSKRMRAMHGLYRSLINNMVVGVSEGYVVEQELVGVGYRASNTGNLLELNLGFSHDIMIEIPEEIKLSTETVKGVPPKIRMESADKQLIGAMAAKIRSLRKPEPYKGKGIRFVGEQIRRKAGKAASAT